MLLGVTWQDWAVFSLKGLQMNYLSILKQLLSLLYLIRNYRQNPFKLFQ